MLRYLTCDDVHRGVRKTRAHGATVGFVPTMGALHAGHTSLVEAAARECDDVGVSIFVNPTQFAPHEDFAKYPRTLEADEALLAPAGAKWIFAPSTDEMYPAGAETSIDVGDVARRWEGAIRPTHFAGVATVVLKLLLIVGPDRVYFGRKDYQQTCVVRRLVRDLNVPVEVRVLPTVREADGLAMSSRNRYLSPDERGRAAALSASLFAAHEAVARGERDVECLRELMLRVLAERGPVELQYIAFLADGTMTDVTQVEGPTTIALAAKVGATRLIDNLVVGE